MIKVVLLLLTMISSAFGLDVAEKLTVRFLKISDTKKTVTLNRGIEDGLAKGDHGKFFLTSGVIARGTVSQLSPSRSIWSLYQIIDKEQVVEDKVVSVKIISPLKITDDETKSISSSEGKVISVSGDELTDDEALEMGEIDESEKMSIGQSFELWALVHLSSFSVYGDSRVKQGTRLKLSDVALSLGIEKYFKHDSDLLKDISVFIFYHHLDNKLASPKGDSLGNVAQEVGLGFNFHFFSPPLSYDKIVGFAQVAFGTGLVEDIINNAQYKGTSRFYSLGLGMKFYLAAGLGFRIIADYYYRNGDYALKGSNKSLVKRLDGFRFMLGLSYRF